MDSPAATAAPRPPPPEPAPRARASLPVLAAPAAVLVLCLALTLLFWRMLDASLDDRMQAAFAESARDIGARVSSRLRDDEQILRGAAGLFQVLPEVRREDWRRYVSSLRLDENFPGILGVGFSAWIPAAGLTAHVREVRREGFPEYAVRPPGDRPIYTSIVFLEPFDWRNQRAFGFDMYAEPVRRLAMDRALDTGASAISGRVTLVQETDKDRQSGTLLYLPVFRPGAPAATPEQRRAAIAGFVYSPIRMKDLVHGALGRLPADVSFELYAAAEAAPEALVFSSLESDPSPVPPGYRAAHELVEPIDVFGGRWLLRYRSLPAFAAGRGPEGARVALAAGLLLSFVLSGVALALARGRSRALALADALRQDERVLEARVGLVDFAQGHSLDELLVRTLDVVEELTGSRIGFYHFVLPDERTLTLQAWSSATSREFCSAEGSGRHYDIDQAGVWVDCIRQRRPVIHDDYAALPHRKGLPPGHAEVLRELAVPVFRQGRIVAVLGLGNKPTSYGEADVALVARFADLAFDIADRKMVIERLQESEARFAAAFESAPVMMTMSRVEDGTYLDVNARFVAVSGYSREEAVGKTSVALGWISAEDRARLARSLAAGGRVDGLELELRTRSGRRVHCTYAGAIITVRGERRLLSIAHDVTAERSLQRQLEQSQKLESVGRLAGGVAHDFNNMLAVIGGYADLLLQREWEDPDVREDLGAIREAAQRSADVTRQLLAFARRQAVAPRVLDLNDTVAGMLKMLRRLIGEAVELDWRPGAGVGCVRMDPSQVDQVLANLCVNARDAVGAAGLVTISSARLELDAAFCGGRPGLVPGSYVRLSVSDTGAGIPAEILPLIFEPFFTTKGVGRGTGLGLATVYGIARQAGGTVEAVSPPGAGASFHVYLPVADEPASARTPPPGPWLGAGAGAGDPPGRDRLVLLVEDEPAVLQLCAGMLRHLGCRVLEAPGPADALRLVELHPEAIELLVTDVVMPGMAGPDLAARARARLPGLRVLFMSGYAPEAVARHGLGTHVPLLQKPFDVATLAARLREVLAEPGAPVARA